MMVSYFHIFALFWMYPPCLRSTIGVGKCENRVGGPLIRLILIPQDSHYCLRKTTCKTDQSLISLCLVSPGSNANKVFKSSVCLDPKMQLTFFSASRAIHTSRDYYFADGPINSFFWPGTLSSFIFFWLHKESDASKNSKNYIFFEHQKRNMNLIITHKKK